MYSNYDFLLYFIDRYKGVTNPKEIEFYAAFVTPL